MPGPIAITEECCHPSCDEPVSIQVPGPAGAAGADGDDGDDGIDAVTTTTAQFTMPAELANVSVSVVDTSWMAVGEPLFVTTAGFMQVVSITNANTVVLKNLEDTATSAYTANAAPATAIPSGSTVTPGGFQGPAGALTGAAGGDLKGTYPNPKIGIGNTKGSLIVGNGTDSIALAVGAAGEVPHADAAPAVGIDWRALDLSGVNTAIGGATPIANGGTGQTTANAAFNALSPVTTRGDLIYRNATVNARLAVGAANTALVTDGTDPAWAKVNANHLATAGATALSRVPSDYILIRHEATSGTAGGDFTSGAWRTRTLNTESADTGSHAAIAANQITLQAGTYRFRAWATAFQVDNHQLRLQNITAGTTVAVGATVRCAAADSVQNCSFVEGRVTIAGATVFELQGQCQTTNAGDGFGAAASFGTECYASIEFEREAL